MALELFKLQLIYHNISYKRLLVKMFILATVMASIPCFNFVIPIDGCGPVWTIENVKVRLNASDLEAAFHELIVADWLIDGYRTLSIGSDSARAVMVLKKLGFPDAMGLYRSCSSLFRRGGVNGLPFKEGAFDFVFSTEMIDGVRVPARLVMEMERVLRPGHVGVVLRRVSGNFPASAVMKAAAPVASFLRFSDVVGVRTVNCTVMVVFKKRTGDEKDDGFVQELRRYSGSAPVISEKIARAPITEMPRDVSNNYLSTHAYLMRRYLFGKPSFGPVKRPPALADEGGKGALVI